jgi:hypothetical protein
MRLALSDASVMLFNKLSFDRRKSRVGESSIVE